MRPSGASTLHQSIEGSGAPELFTQDSGSDNRLLRHCYVHTSLILATSGYNSGGESVAGTVETRNASKRSVEINLNWSEDTGEQRSKKGVLWTSN